MTCTIRLIQEKDDPVIEMIIRQCLIEYGGNHEGTAWDDPDLGRFSKIYNKPILFAILTARANSRW